MQSADDKTREMFNNILSSFTGKAAGELGASGHSLLDTSISSNSAAFGSSRDMKSDWIKNILGAIETGASVAGAV